MGVRLEYIYPIAFGFVLRSSPWSALTGRKATQPLFVLPGSARWLSRRMRRNRMFFSVFPTFGWAFSPKRRNCSSGSRYLSIVGPLYAFYGLGMALYFATQDLADRVDGYRKRVACCKRMRGLLAVLWLMRSCELLCAVAGGFVITANERTVLSATRN